MVPSEFHLSQNYPNPFSGKTKIKFCVAYKTKVTIDVLHCQSDVMTRLMDEEEEAGTYEIEFDAGRMAEGAYLCILQAGDFVATKQMLMKR